MSDYLYFIQCGDGGPIKIGISFDVKSRMRTLQTACPYPLKLLYSHGPLDDAAGYESRLHKRYAATRMQGEWFLPTHDLVGHIRQIEAVESEPETEEASS